MNIIITSCCKLQQIPSQPVWEDIKNEQPDVLLLIGDNIYLNHDKHKDPARLQAELRKLYGEQLSEPHFQELITDITERGASLLAIYDDHDFIGNNRYGGDNDPTLREVARKELINTFSVPTTQDDVYSVSKTHLVDIIVLDERFYRTKPAISKNDRDAILGDRQWEWLEDTISSSISPYLMIASSSTYHHFIGESWEKYPKAFNRLNKLISNRKGAFIVSGDVHRNALYDDSDVMEVVTSAVARKSIVFGKKRQNYGVLTFDDEGMNIDLRSFKAGWRFNVTVALNNWSL